MSLQSKSKTFWSVAVIASAMLAGLPWLRASESDRATDEELPPMQEAQASCPAPREHAGHSAQAALVAAKAREQRYAFAPRDGRIALERLAEAFECARIAGDERAARSAAEQQTSLRARIERDARDHFRRYQHLKRRDRLDEATRDLAFLVELGWPESGPLADRLRRDHEAAAAVTAGARR